MILQKQSGLGRGLGAIIPQKPSTVGDDNTKPAASAPEVDLRNFIKEVPVAMVERNPHQPRRHFDHGELEDLISSIKEHGVMQPVIVTDLGGGKYQLIAGERRLRASTIAGLQTIPAIVREATDLQKLELAIIENIQRADLNAIEEAHAFQRLIDDFGMTQEEVGKKMGKSRPQIANTIRLLQLPAEIQQALVDKKINQSHARTLLALPNEAEQIKLFKTMTGGHVTVREAEEIAYKTRKVKPFNANAAALEDELRSIFNVKTHVKASAEGKTEITFTATSTEELSALVGAFKKSKA